MIYIEALKVLNAVINLVEDDDNLISLLWGKLVDYCFNRNS